MNAIGWAMYPKWNHNIAYRAACLTGAFFAGYAASYGHFDALAEFLAWLLLYFTDIYVESKNDY